MKNLLSKAGSAIKWSTLAILAFGYSQVASAIADVNQIKVIELVQKFDSAKVSFDPETLSKVIADIYVEVSPTGEIIPRQQFLALYIPQHKTSSNPDLSSHRWNVKTIKDTAEVLSLVEYDIKTPDSTTTEHVTFRVVYVAHLYGDDWKLISVQYTPLITTHSAPAEHN
jgi:uncharacterized protein DUF4440